MKPENKKIVTRLEATTVLHAILALVMALVTSNDFNFIAMWMDSTIFKIATVTFCWFLSPLLIKILKKKE